MDSSSLLPHFLQEKLQKLNFNYQNVSSPTPNAFCLQLLPRETTSTDPSTEPQTVFIKCLALDDCNPHGSTPNSNCANFAADLYFANEITFYSRVLSNFTAMEATCRDAINMPFSSIPACIYADASCVILEDLHSAGYRPLDINAALHYEGARVVLQQLARFHAFSIALRHHQPALFEDVTKDLHPTNEDPTSRAIFVDGVKDALKLAKSAFPSGSAYVERMSFFVLDVYKHHRPIDGATSGTSSDIYKAAKVVTHGDLWPGNILLRYNQDDVVVSAKFVDFQGCRFSSWVNDLMAVVLIAVDRSARQEHLHDLLECYRNAICVQLQALQVDQHFINSIFSTPDFEKQLQQKTKHVMATALAGLPLYIQPSQERTSESVHFPDADPVVAYFRNVRAKKSMKCKNRMLEIIMDVVDYGYLE